MEANNKKSKSILNIIMCFVLIAVFLSAIVGAKVFRESHKYSVKYNDWWIVGRSKAEIVERYGPLERNGFDSYGYRLSSSSFYMIEFDSNGYAREVYRGIVSSA